MSDKLGNDFVHYTEQGIFFYDSSSQFTPSTSQSSLPQITQLTCSADVGNNIARTSSLGNILSGYFIVPLITGSPAQLNTIPSQLNVVYNTGSFFAVSSSNTSSYHQPTSSFSINNYILNVAIEKNDNANAVASKTYDALTSSIIYAGNSANNTSYGYNFISASLTGSAITFFNQFSQSISPIFISASGFVSNILQSGSYGSGSAINYTAPRGEVPVQSSSLVIARDVEDSTQSSFIFRVQSGSFGGTEHRDILYISASEGKIGIGTTEPLSAVDIRADDFQIQRKTERRGFTLNEEGNIESFDRDIESATTGSEFLLRYSRGVEITPSFMANFVGLAGGATGSSSAHAVALFNDLPDDVRTQALFKAEESGKIRPPITNDVLGQIRWISDSGSLGTLDKRGTGETAVIKAVVNDADSTGIRADLIFSVASKTSGASQKFLIDALNKHQITGSLEISDDLTVVDDTSIGGDLGVTGELTGNITASGNISSSLIGARHSLGGTLTSNKVQIRDTADGSLKVGNNQVLHTGVEANAPNVTVGAATNVTAVATTDNAEFFVGVLDGASGAQAVETSTRLKYNPNSGKLTVSGEISSSGNIISNNVNTVGTGSFGRLEATSNVALQVSNSQQIVFENSAGTEFGQITMNTNDNMLFQNLRSNKDLIMRAGNSGNEGHIIIQPGGDTSTNIAKFGKTAGLDLLGNFTSSGNISASGNIIANTLTLNASTVETIKGPALGLDSAGQVRIDSAGSTINFSRNATDAYIINPGISSHKFTGHITASGAISASGTITATNGFGTING